MKHRNAQQNVEKNFRVFVVPIVTYLRVYNEE